MDEVIENELISLDPGHRYQFITHSWVHNSRHVHTYTKHTGCGGVVLVTVETGGYLSEGEDLEAVAFSVEDDWSRAGIKNVNEH